MPNLCLERPYVQLVPACHCKAVRSGASAVPNAPGIIPSEHWPRQLAHVVNDTVCRAAPEAHQRSAIDGKSLREEYEAGQIRPQHRRIMPVAFVLYFHPPNSEDAA